MRISGDDLFARSRMPTLLAGVNSSRGKLFFFRTVDDRIRKFGNCNNSGLGIEPLCRVLNDRVKGLEASVAIGTASVQRYSEDLATRVHQLGSSKVEALFTPVLEVFSERMAESMAKASGPDDEASTRLARELQQIVEDSMLLKPRMDEVNAMSSCLRDVTARFGTFVKESEGLWEDSVHAHKKYRRLKEYVRTQRDLAAALSDLLDPSYAVAAAGPLRSALASVDKDGMVVSRIAESLDAVRSVR